MAVEIACLADIVRAHGARQPESAAIIYAGRATSYGALDGASRKRELRKPYWSDRER